MSGGRFPASRHPGALGEPGVELPAVWCAELRGADWAVGAK